MSRHAMPVFPDKAAAWVLPLAWFTIGGKRFAAGQTHYCAESIANHASQLGLRRRGLLWRDRAEDLIGWELGQLARVRRGMLPDNYSPAPFSFRDNRGAVLEWPPLRAHQTHLHDFCNLRLVVIAAAAALTNTFGWSELQEQVAQDVERLVARVGEHTDWFPTVAPCGFAICPQLCAAVLDEFLLNRHSTTSKWSRHTHAEHLVCDLDTMIHQAALLAGTAA